MMKMEGQRKRMTLTSASDNHDNIIAHDEMIKIKNENMRMRARVV